MNNTLKKWYIICGCSVLGGQYKNVIVEITEEKPWQRPSLLHSFPPFDSWGAIPCVPGRHLGAWEASEALGDGQGCLDLLKEFNFVLVYLRQEAVGFFIFEVKAHLRTETLVMLVIHFRNSKFFIVLFQTPSSFWLYAFEVEITGEDPWEGPLSFAVPRHSSLGVPSPACH